MKQRPSLYVADEAAVVLMPTARDYADFERVTKALKRVRNECIGHPPDSKKRYLEALWHLHDGMRKLLATSTGVSTGIIPCKRMHGFPVSSGTLPHRQLRR